MSLFLKLDKTILKTLTFLSENDKILVQGDTMDLSNFSKYLEALEKNKIPKENQMLDMDLYMEQLINFLNHINFILQRDFDDKIITSSMINNYVKGNVIESPIKKKYQKSHVGQLLRISFYKKILEINDCKKLFEFEKHIYKKKGYHNSFVDTKEQIFKSRINELKKMIDNKELDNYEKIHQYMNERLINAFLDITLVERLIDFIDIDLQKKNKE